MQRRRFMFWVGMGLFSLSEKLRADVLDDLAAAGMPGPKSPPVAPTHWRAAENAGWRWYERETFVGGQWKLTGITTPVNRQSGELYSGREGYLAESLVPGQYRESNEDDAEETPDDRDFDHHPPSRTRRARHGRPPSKWLRSLHADELRIWLKTIDVPAAGVEGMTYYQHLTRDHSFASANVEALTTNEQAQLHAAAHHGY